MYEAERLGNLLQGIANSMKMPDVYVGGDSSLDPKPSYSSDKPSEDAPILAPSFSLPASLSEAGLPLIAAGAFGLYLLMSGKKGKKGKGRRKGKARRKGRSRRKR